MIKFKPVVSRGSVDKTRIGLWDVKDGRCLAADVKQEWCRRNFLSIKAASFTFPLLCSMENSFWCY